VLRRVQEFRAERRSGRVAQAVQKSFLENENFIRAGQPRVRGHRGKKEEEPLTVRCGKLEHNQQGASVRQKTRMHITALKEEGRETAESRPFGGDPRAVGSLREKGKGLLNLWGVTFQRDRSYKRLAGKRLRIKGRKASFRTDS